jgi:MerR family transcriptional regulator, light-induced transcriptional regulator
MTSDTHSDDILLSPKELAAAIGASESSLRRWVDSGDIRISRTAGGHRRIPLREAVQFIRKIGAVVVRPEVLKLPSLPADAKASPASEGAANLAHSDGERLFAALADGDAPLARGLVLSWYLQGRATHELFDGPVRDAMHRLGELWKHDQRGILIEHRATDICLGILSGLRGLLPAAQPSAPLAIGGAAPGDPYQLPSLMVATVLSEAGLPAVNYGADTPLLVLGDEAVRNGAQLVWLSISSIADAAALRTSLKALAQTLEERSIDLILGGHAVSEVAPRAMQHVHAMGSMGELAAFVRGLRAGRPAAP